MNRYFRARPRWVKSRPKASAEGDAPTVSPSVVAPAPAAAPPLLETPSTLNEGSFFNQGEILARVGVKDVDEVLFSFQESPDAYVRIIPTIAKPRPIALVRLNAAAEFAPLLKLNQYGSFTYANRLGAVAYDPGGPIAEVLRTYPGRRSCFQTGNYGSSALQQSCVNEVAGLYGFRSRSFPR